MKDIIPTKDSHTKLVLLGKKLDKFSLPCYHKIATGDDLEKEHNKAKAEPYTPLSGTLYVAFCVSI